MQRINTCAHMAVSPDTMLIVDDDAINRGILENIFAPYYAIAQAENGKDGLAYLHAHRDRVCAVLLDVLMPGMSGIEVLRVLSGEELLGQIPVFLITAEASGGTMKEAYRMGVMDVISKPVIPYVGAAAGSFGGGAVPSSKTAGQRGGAAAIGAAAAGPADH